MKNYEAAYENEKTGGITTRKIQAYTAEEAWEKALRIKEHFLERGYDLIELDQTEEA